MATKTGGQSRPWVDIERPKPPRVPDVKNYWADPPPEKSERCRYWLRQFDLGWRPNRRIMMHGYYSAAEWYGVYLWEYLNVIYPIERAP